MKIVDKVSYSDIKEIITEEINSININEIDLMTISQLKDNLTKRNIGFTTKLKKNELKNLLIETIEK